MTTARKRIAIIGGGSSGLTAIKSCVEQGLEPVCFERDGDVGGLWRYKDDADAASVYRSCVFNTSKELTGFSDFPVPADYPPFLSHAFFLRYLRLYAKAFDLMRHIRFNVAVVGVRPAVDYETTGRWTVAYRRRGDDDADCVVETYDGVMLCTGHHWNPHVPTFDGLDMFAGSVLHSHAYRTGKDMMGKRILIIGKRTLLTEAEMTNDVNRKSDAIRGQYVQSQRHTLEAFWIPLMDELAAEVGARPDLWCLFKRDPFLALRCLVGPCVPAQYRLMGPGAWSGAKTTIQDTFRNTMAPLKQRAVPPSDGASQLIVVDKCVDGGVATWRIYYAAILMLLLLVFMYKCACALVA
ncbi:PREDICTED: dimethylaniline monooxygenase [N-oxide-forming] 5-like [Priapulus caudatus]|uniref:Flavin-containing monooxygenase n=1 Tax=Priapulus caudatus TaxID=37621 RepID=A0ABM1F2A5_PRICU|nr:PREDICTED: dimethylaniline monooxygenase [N-oxide-forming] 5-like [Priapulus caudatus]